MSLQTHPMKGAKEVRHGNGYVSFIKLGSMVQSSPARIPIGLTEIEIQIYLLL